MKKEDVLLRSREENKKGDELQRSNKSKSERYGYYTISIILLVFAILTEFDAVKGVVDIFGMQIQFRDFCFLSMILSLFVECISKYYFLRKKRYLAFSIFWAIGFLAGMGRVFGL